MHSVTESNSVVGEKLKGKKIGLYKGIFCDEKHFRISDN